ncbi:MAG: hypothetical protein GDA50_07925 [Alphaproteobacteria bacterium GM202ARS2]|nr:hypothetical protein [Alphaproteobacteria bacterium GM202ARS2]
MTLRSCIDCRFLLAGPDKFFCGRKGPAVAILNGEPITHYPEISADIVAEWGCQHFELPTVPDGNASNVQVLPRPVNSKATLARRPGPKPLKSLDPASQGGEVEKDRGLPRLIALKDPAATGLPNDRAAGRVAAVGQAKSGG